MVETMDTNVGRVLDGLNRLGLDENTIVIFTSDNGGYPPITSNLPFRGGKGWAYEGGTREPWLVKWPGVTQPRSECHVPVIFTDVFPTVLEMAGLPLRPDLHCDGTSFAPLLKGDNKPIHDALFLALSPLRQLRLRPIQCPSHRRLEVDRVARRPIGRPLQSRERPRRTK